MSDNAFESVEPILGEFQIVDAVAPDGRRSHGTIRFEPHGHVAHSHAIIDRTQDRFGLAVLFHGRLLIATGPKDKVEIGAYRLTGDTLTGIWVPPGAKGCDLAMCGREVSRRVDTDTYEIESAHAVDQQPYTGKLRLSYLDPESTPVRRVRFNWSLHDGDYSSFGVAHGDVLVGTFNFEPGTPYAIGLYVAENERWVGSIAHHGEEQLSHESLVR